MNVNLIEYAIEEYNKFHGSFSKTTYLYKERK